ncbi:hypothetical protein KCH_18200 [Kitasatospora cheerisanensis KCTC 2395]|uniref:Major facilitator superfamily (MFS) profile domain-containing protein n=1 Tax=Kitasatospora cheerisanensis KCTC 2395 TaxID=1348663 RepID=A0A066YWT2_9ACTN|nr:MFS transporter [Kitasatospora cheerisanensis]KDN86003.1 hypothetical protein KCH_18200 [Kitasatospora cheerisanensis KCTC 2395]
MGAAGRAALAVPLLGRWESRRADPLLEVRLLRSAPVLSALVMAFAALCAFGAFLFAVTLYLQGVRGMPALRAGLCLAPVGVLIVLLSPWTGRTVGRRGPRLPLLLSGSALALAGGLLLLVGPGTPVPALLAVFALVGVFQGTVNPPITNTAVSGMPASMAALASALASAARQTGSAVGVAVAGTVLAGGVAAGGAAFTGRRAGVVAAGGGGCADRGARRGGVGRRAGAPGARGAEGAGQAALRAQSAQSPR